MDWFKIFLIFQLGNHDNWRIGSRTNPELMDAFNLITLTLPGIAVTYQGEEIGMTNGNITFEDTVDPSGLKKIIRKD